MTTAAIAASLVFGLFSGVVSGLVGIGGGVLLVPFLYFMLEHGGWSGIQIPADRATLVAHATSLSVIVVTALSALRTYARAGLVPWRVMAPMALGAALVAVEMARLASSFPEALLRLGFVVFLFLVGLRLLTSSDTAAEGVAAHAAGPPHPMPGLLGGVVIGAVAPLLGVGGGTLAIPFLIYVVHVDIRRVAAGSVGVVAAAAAAGMIGYMTVGGGADLPGTFGLIHVPLALSLAPGSMVGARLGARLNQRIHAGLLRRLFAVLLLALAARLAFTTARAEGWLGTWPVQTSTRPAPRAIVGS